MTGTSVAPFLPEIKYQPVGRRRSLHPRTGADSLRFFSCGSRPMSPQGTWTHGEKRALMQKYIQEDSVKRVFDQEASSYLRDRYPEEPTNCEQ